MSKTARFELRTDRISKKQYLQEAPPFSSNINDRLSQDLKNAVAKACRKCPELHKCEPSMSLRRWGILQTLSLVVNGERVAGDNCGVRISGVEVTQSKIKERRTLLAMFTKQEKEGLEVKLDP